METWIPINMASIQPEALCLFYSPQGNYIWATGMQLEEIRKEHPGVTHYKVFAEAPSI